MREEFDKLKDSLNEFEIAYLEKEYIKSNPEPIDFKNFDIWLFERWSKGNEN